MWGKHLNNCFNLTLQMQHNDNDYRKMHMQALQTVRPVIQQPQVAKQRVILETH